MERTVFISYGREDLGHARRLFCDLCGTGFEPWLDDEFLRPGQRWKAVIKRAIRNSRFFIALVSSKSITRRGFLRSEIRDALEILREHPESDTFLIPARLDDCEMPEETLWELHRVDMFPDWETGVKRIVKAMAIAHRPVTAYIAIQFRQVDTDMFTRVFVSANGREHVFPGYEKPQVAIEGDPLFVFLLSDSRIVEVHWVHGSFDVLAIVKTETVVAVGQILDQIRSFPHVLNTSTTLSVGRLHPAGGT